MEEPSIIAEERAYVVAFKPRGMHGAPLAADEAGTLLAWCAERFPEVLEIRGKKAVEGGLLHRLDRETEGLMILARTQAFYDALIAQQAEGRFVKEYEADCVDARSKIFDGRGWPLPGFPPAPEPPIPPCRIESAFRPYGPGRRAVRPLAIGDAEREIARTKGVALDRGELYRTELLTLDRTDEGYVRIRARLARGFRHQVRCHLAWTGFPIHGDGLYCGISGGAFSLSAVKISFLDPSGSRPISYELVSSTGSKRTS